LVAAVDKGTSGIAVEWNEKFIIPAGVNRLVISWYRFTEVTLKKKQTKIGDLSDKDCIEERIYPDVKASQFVDEGKLPATTSSIYNTAYVNVTPGEKYKIDTQTYGARNYAYIFAYYDGTNYHALQGVNVGITSNYITGVYEVEIPQGVNVLICTYYYAYSFKIYKIN
jgi:hypothetical protein